MMLFHLLCALAFLTLTRCASGPVFETETSDVGQTVTLRCPRNSSESNTYLYWIRFLPGNVPETLGGTLAYDNSGSYGSPHSSIKTKQEPGLFVLSIERPQLSDTGLYYCVKVQNLIRNLAFVRVIFLNIKGPVSDVRVESPDLSGPVDSGDSVDLQCWVQMENAQCFEEHMVWWFRSGLDQSGPGLVYAQWNSSAQCKRSTEDPGPHKCLYTLSKTMSPSDTGTYRCAVAACGHILFGTGTKVTVTENKCDFEKTIIIVLSALLTVSVTVTMVLVYSIIKRKCCFYVGQNTDDANRTERTRQQREAELMYSAPKFKKKAEKSHGRKVKAEDFVVYSDVRK